MGLALLQCLCVGAPAHGGGGSAGGLLRALKQQIRLLQLVTNEPAAPGRTRGLARKDELSREGDAPNFPQRCSPHSFQTLFERVIRHESRRRVGIKRAMDGMLTSAKLP